MFFFIYFLFVGGVCVNSSRNSLNTTYTSDDQTIFNQSRFKTIVEFYLIVHEFIDVNRCNLKREKNKIDVAKLKLHHSILLHVILSEIITLFQRRKELRAYGQSVNKLIVCLKPLFERFLFSQFIH